MSFSQWIWIWSWNHQKRKGFTSGIYCSLRPSWLLHLHILPNDPWLKHLLNCLSTNSIYRETKSNMSQQLWATPENAMELDKYQPLDHLQQCNNNKKVLLVCVQPLATDCFLLTAKQTNHKIHMEAKRSEKECLNKAWSVPHYPSPLKHTLQSYSNKMSG